jgi:hypothetical protein
MEDRASEAHSANIDELFSRYKTLRLHYFPNWKVSPWEKRDHDAAVQVFLRDLEAYLLGNDWSLEKKTDKEMLFRYIQTPEVFLKISHKLDYFGVETVYLIEVELRRERSVLWPELLAEGEVVFDHLRRME